MSSFYETIIKYTCYVFVLRDQLLYNDSNLF